MAWQNDKSRPIFWSFASNNKCEQFSRFPVSLAGLLSSQGINTVWLRAGFIEALQRRKAASTTATALRNKKIVQLYKDVPEQCLTPQHAVLSRCEPLDAERAHIVFDLADSLSQQTLDLFLCADQRIYFTAAYPAAKEMATLFLNKCFLRLVELEFPLNEDEWRQSQNALDPLEPLPDLAELSFFDSERLTRIRRRTDELDIHLVCLQAADDKGQRTAGLALQEALQPLFPAMSVHGPWLIDPSFGAWFTALDKYFNQTSGALALQILQEIDQRFAESSSADKAVVRHKDLEQAVNQRAYTIIHNQLVLNLAVDEAEHY